VNDLPPVEAGVFCLGHDMITERPQQMRAFFADKMQYFSH
jgi:hypothetical protein